MNIENIKSVYFVGAGGIGMSALIRYFLSKGKLVAGYDRTPSELTEHLIAEGAQIHYEENVDLIPEACKNAESTLEKTESKSLPQLLLHPKLPHPQIFSYVNDSPQMHHNKVL